jgi:hypothetical protein
MRGMDVAVGAYYSSSLSTVNVNGNIRGLTVNRG